MFIFNMWCSSLRQLTVLVETQNRIHRTIIATETRMGNCLLVSFLVFLRWFVTQFRSLISVHRSSGFMEILVVVNKCIILSSSMMNVLQLNYLR
jgi:hypothetical protein